MAREPYVALLMAAYGSQEKIFTAFFLEKNILFFWMTFFLKESFLKTFFSGMALTELH